MDIDNEIYDRKADDWWAEDGDPNLVSLRFINHRVKADYIRSVLDQRLNKGPAGEKILDVGSGGGFLAEDLARAGFEVCGVDLSLRSVRTAAEHARSRNLAVDYLQAGAENLPFKDESFDFVCCCDVLEHVADPGLVAAEVSRVLKPRGLFFYETINRTLFSRLVMIKMLQEWKSTAFFGDRVHVWRMFIKPRELVEILARHRMRNIEIKGLAPSWNLPGHYLNLRRLVRGKISMPELGRRLRFGLSGRTDIAYVGFAEKNGQGAARVRGRKQV